MLETWANDEIGIANCFIKKHQTFFKLYSVYCHNYNAYGFLSKNLDENMTSLIFILSLLSLRAYNASEKLELNPSVERLIEVKKKKIFKIDFEIKLLN
jgi:hypothetical protein